MASQTPSAEISPRRTYRVMAGMAVTVICLLGLAIYSLSRMETAPWASSLLDPKIQAASPKTLPEFQHLDGSKSLTPQKFERKWTLLSFWSYACAPCLEEMPALNQLALSWSGPEFQILTVNVDLEKTESLDFAKRFLLEQDISLPTYFDLQANLSRAFGVNAFPTHFLVNPDKKIIWEATGAFKWNDSSARDQLLKLIEQQDIPETLVPDPAE